MDESGELGDRPHIYRIVGNRFVGTKAYWNSAIAQLSKRHDTATEFQVAQGIVCDNASGVGKQFNIPFIDPYGMNDIASLIQYAVIVEIADKRLSMFLLTHDSLELGFQYVNEMRKVVLLTEFMKGRQQIWRDSLRR